MHWRKEAEGLQVVWMWELVLQNQAEEGERQACSRQEEGEKKA